LRRDEFDFLFIENPLSNVSVCTLFIDFNTLIFTFFFEILALLMKFLAFPCGDYVTGHLAMETMTASEKSTGDFWNFFHK